MSLRAIERAHVIRLVTGPESEPVVRSLALGIGYTFALLGALTTLGVAIAPATGPLQQAQLPCALTASCV